MTIITSQQYRNPEIVEEKKVKLANETEINLPVYEVGFDDLYILADGHHSFDAANELGITINFQIVAHQDGFTGEVLLENCWCDSDYRDLVTGKSIF